MTIRLRRFIVNFTISLLSVLITFGVLEIIARRLVPVSNWVDFRKSSVAYENVPYNVDTMLENGQQIKINTPDGTRLIMTDDIATDYINVQNHLRVTVGSPKDYQHTIYVFGGSTIFCAEVPDEYTIPSLLQKNVSDYRVLNYGTTSVNTAQQLELLKTVDLTTGDIVVFYDGVNDITQGVYYQHPEGWIMGETWDQYVNFDPLTKWRYSMWQQYKDWALATALFYPWGRGIPSHLQDLETVSTLAQQTADQYEANVQKAHDYVVQQGATFYHFLQPQIWTINTLSDYEQQLISNPFLIATGLQVSFTTTYPFMRESLLKLDAKGVQSTDLSHVLDAYRTQGEEFYLDYVHVNHIANDIIARAIYNELELP